MNDLTTIDQSALQDLDELLGTEVTGGGGSAIVRVPELVINSKSRDKETKKPIPEGSFYLKNMDQKVFAESVTFRPLASHIQYFKWDEIDGKRTLVNKSMAVARPSDDALDMQGTIACGMPPWEELKEMDYAEAKEYKQMRNRVTRGLVSYSGKTMNGEEVTIENQPCIMFHKNSTYGGFWNGFMSKLPKGKKIYEYQATMEADYNENGSVIWYTPTYSVDLSNPLPVTQEIFDTMKVFAETIKRENEAIREAYWNARNEDMKDQAAIKGLGDSLDDDFEDVA